MMRKLIYVPTGLASFGVAGLCAVVAAQSPFLSDKERMRLAAFGVGSAVAGTACIRTAFRRKCECDCKCKCKK